MLLQRLPLQRVNQRCKHLLRTNVWFCSRPRASAEVSVLHSAAAEHDFQAVAACLSHRPAKAPAIQKQYDSGSRANGESLEPGLLEQWLPADVQPMCCAPEHAPEVWGADETVRKELSLHGETWADLENLVRALAARRFLVADLQAGRLYERSLSAAAAPSTARLNEEQRQVFCRVVAELD